MKYIPALRAFTTADVSQSHMIKAINNNLFSDDFWKKGSMYVSIVDIDIFMEKALEQYTVTTISN